MTVTDYDGNTINIEETRKGAGKMSGHSKFANIKHKKEKNDAAKGKIFTVIGREIAVAVKEGGADPANNSKLRDVIAKAKANNMPNDNITAASSMCMAAGKLSRSRPDTRTVTSIRGRSSSSNGMTSNPSTIPLPNQRGTTPRR